MTTSFRSFSVIDHPRYLDHQTGGGEHPEIPARVGLIRERLQNGVLRDHVTFVEATSPDRRHITAVHDEAYLFRFEEAVLSGQNAIDHHDNQICYESYEVALLAAGGCLTGIDLIESGQTELAFCNIRPPGHHAERASALGFCFLNNAAIAARYWQKKYQRQRIFILDWDAHHGNGIQSAFEHDPEVFYASIHEHPTFSFPGTGYAEDNGTGKGGGSTLNIPLPPGADDQRLLQAMAEQVGPAIETFQPEALIVAAGFDGHLLDDMSGLNYSTKVYGQLGVYMNVWGKKYCQGRVLSILEGGYHPQALAASAEAYLAGLSAIPPAE